MTPGVLAERLDWLTEPLFAAVRQRPELALQLLSLDWRRLHLAAVVAAHGPQGQEELLCDAFIRSARSVAATALGNAVPGVVGLLDRLPNDVMPAEAYRRAVALLRDPASARLLMHRAIAIDADTLALLEGLPPQLRTRPVLSALAGLASPAQGPELLAAWIDLIRRRLRAGERFDPANMLARARTQADLRTSLLDLAGKLQWAASEPPEHVGPARRIDDRREIRRFGRLMKNCLAASDHENVGVIYAWREEQCEIACQVSLRGRLGWFLGERKLAGNQYLSAELDRRVVSTFAAAGVPEETLSDLSEMMIATLSEQISAKRRAMRTGETASHEADDGDEEYLLVVDDR